MSDRLTELYERSDKIEKELNKLSHNLRIATQQRKDELLKELQQVIDEIEKLEDGIPNE